MPPLFFVRYGQMSHVGRFAATSTDHHRGEPVLLQTHRGQQLGEVLGRSETSSTDESLSPSGHILRTASPDDLNRAQQAASKRSGYLALFDEIFSDGHWPIVLVDAEPLLDDDQERCILFYLGPHHLEDEGLRLAIRNRRGLEVLLEPVGRDLPVDEPAPGQITASASSSCGSGGCGSSSSSGGCGSCGSTTEDSGSACSTSCGAKHSSPPDGLLPPDEPSRPDAQYPGSPLNSPPKHAIIKFLKKQSLGSPLLRRYGQTE